MVMRKFDHPLPDLDFHHEAERYNQFALPVRRNTPTDQVHLARPRRREAWPSTTLATWDGTVHGRTEMASSTASKYGANFISSFEPNQDVEDWPMTVHGVPSHITYRGSNHGESLATNEGPLLPMSANYPLRRIRTPRCATAFKNAAEASGYSPFPTPSCARLHSPT